LRVASYEKQEARSERRETLARDTSHITERCQGEARVVLRELGRFSDDPTLECCMAARQDLTGGLQIV
jgi:hypothetical protein